VGKGNQRDKGETAMERDRMEGDPRLLLCVAPAFCLHFKYTA